MKLCHNMRQLCSCQVVQCDFSLVSFSSLINKKNFNDYCNDGFFFIVPVKYTVKDRQAGKDSFVNFGIFLYSVCGFLCMINLRKIKMSSIFI